jgi:hypothetical protein
VSREDATGPARFSVVCGLEDGTPRAGYATFQVRASAGGTSAGAGANNTNRTDRIQDPTQIGTELGGTAEGGIDSVWLLLSVGLLLIALIVGLWLRQATVGRRR